MIRYLVYNVIKDKEAKQREEMKMMRKAYEKAIKAGKTKETYEEFANRVEYNARQFIGTDGGTMEEYIERQTEYYDKVISRQEEAEVYKEEARQALRQADRKEMVEIIANVANEKNPAKVLAYKEARKEIIDQVNSRRGAFGAFEIGLTGPVYDDDENPSYF